MREKESVRDRAGENDITGGFREKESVRERECERD